MTDLSLREQIASTICGDRAVDNWNATDADYEMADAILELIRGAVKPLEWRIAHDHWRAASLDGVYGVGDAGGGCAFVSVPYGGEVKTMRVYPFDFGKRVAEALHARARILAALGVK